MSDSDLAWATLHVFCRESKHFLPCNGRSSPPDPFQQPSIPCDAVGAIADGRPYGARSWSEYGPTGRGVAAVEGSIGRRGSAARRPCAGSDAGRKGPASLLHRAFFGPPPASHVLKTLRVRQISAQSPTLRASNQKRVQLLDLEWLGHAADHWDPFPRPSPTASSVGRRTLFRWQKPRSMLHIATDQFRIAPTAWLITHVFG